MANGLIGSEFQPGAENFQLRLNDQEVRKALSTIYSRGAFAVSTSVYTSSQTMDHRVSVALCDTSGGAISLTLPYANYWGDSKSPNITFVHVAGSADVTILPAGSDSIDGVGSYTLSAGERVDIVSDGDDSWYILAGAASTSVTTVRSYGALGDGVTNDTAAFTAAGSADTDLTMVVPSGVYRLATNPAPTGNTTWLVYPEVFFAGPGKITTHVLPGTLNGSITNSATSITLNSTSGWPAITTSHTSFYAVLSDGTGYEIIKVTAINTGTNVLTVERGKYGTSGRAFGNASDCALNLLSPKAFHYIRAGVTTSMHDDRGGLSVLDSSTFSQLTKGYASLRVGMFDGWESNYWGLPGAGTTAATSDWVAFQAGIASNAERQRLWVSNMTLEIGTDSAVTPATAWGVELDVGIYASNPNATGGGLGHASDPGNDYHVLGIDLQCVGTYNPSVAFRCSSPSTTRWKHGIWLQAIGWKTTTTADAGWGIGSTLIYVGSDCSVEHGFDLSRGTYAGFGIKLGSPSTGTAPIGLMQFANGGTGVFLQRKTDTAPTGNMIALANAANSSTLFSLGVAGDINTVSTITATGTITGGNLSTGGAVTATGNISGAAITGTSLVSTGTLNLSSAGAGQIQFPASQNASAGANVLDDYEEGTWTPGIRFAGGSTGQTYSIASGYYTKIGDRVFCTARVEFSAKGSSTGAATISGLPFTSLNANGNMAAVAVYAYNLTYTGRLQAYVTPNATTLTLADLTEAGAAANLDDTNFANNTGMMFDFSYKVA